MRNKKVWIITGASGGLGLSLARKLIDQGHYVAAASRDRNHMLELMGDETDHFLALNMNPVDEIDIKKARKRVLEQFGTLDVIVNNAGYALRGMIEEVSDVEARKSFDINVFGVLNMIRGFGDILREKRDGYIFNISSIAGYKTSAWSGLYGAGKHAVEGISEALYHEMKPFNVKVISVKPGDMRTSFHEPGRLVIAEKRILDYKETCQNSYDMIIKKNGHQTSDPEKIAGQIISLTGYDELPFDLFIGSDSYRIALDKMSEVQYSLESQKEISLSVGWE